MSKNIFQQYISKNDRVVIGVSGGPDSVYLLLQTLKYTKKIIVAHVNHKTRGRENIRDAKFVRELAYSHHLTFELREIMAEARRNLEDHFRQKRYQFFEDVRQKHKAQWILTAHHLNDNIETVLFNLTKGSFLDGLSGMDVVDYRRHLLRPLLFTPKSDILAHLNKTKTPYRNDRTNRNIQFSRNRMRHKVIPQLKNINTSLEQTFARNIGAFQELRAYLDQMTTAWLEQNYQDRHIDHQEFSSLHPVMQKSVLFQLYSDLYGAGKKLNQNHLTQIMKVVSGKDSNKKKEFGDDYFLNIQKKDGRRVIMVTEKP